MLAALALGAIALGSAKKTKAAAVIDATPKVAAPKGVVTIGEPRIIKTAKRLATKKPAAPAKPKVAAKPKKPSPKPVGPLKVVKTKPPTTAKKQAAGTAVSSKLRTLVPQQPSAGVAAPPGTNLALAKQTASDVAKHIQNKGRKYNTAVLKQFQARAGMRPDGLYGPASASALRYFGANAPAPLFKGANAKYVPPGG